LWEEKVAWFNSNNVLQIYILLVCFSADRPLGAGLLEDTWMSQHKIQVPQFGCFGTNGVWPCSEEGWFVRI